MIDEFKRTIAVLREKYTSKDDVKAIDDLERGMSDILEMRKLADNPVFKSISNKAKARIEEIQRTLSTDRKLDTAQRLALFHELDVYELMSAQFGLKPADQAIEFLLTAAKQRM